MAERTARLLLIAGVLAGPTYAATTHAQDKVEVSAKARELFEAGVVLLEDSGGPRYEEAYRAFKAAYEDSPSPSILGNLGLCAMKLERDGEALDAYRRYLSEANDIPDDERKQIQKDLKVLQASSATLTVEVEEPGWSVVDERVPTRGGRVRNAYGPFDASSAAIVMRAGRHELVVKRADGTEKKLSVTLAPKEKKVIEAAAETSEPATPSEPSPYPLAYVARPMTLPTGMFAPALGVRAGSQVRFGESQVAVGLDLLTAKVGLIDNLELDVTAVPLEIQPDVDYGTATARVTYRYLDTVVELGSALRVGHVLFPGQDRRALIEPQILRALAHAGDMVRIDSGFFLPILINGDGARIGMNIPIDVAVQAHELVHVGLGTGVGIFDFEDASGNVFIPIGAFMGVAIPREDDTPLLDIGGGFRFPRLFQPGTQGNRIEQRHYVGSLTFRLYFQL